MNYLTQTYQMKKNKLIYIGVATLLSLSSCSDEHADGPVGGDSTIRFAPTLSDIAWSRAADVTYDNFYTFQATCFNPAQPTFDGNGMLQPYFEDITFGRISADEYIAADDVYKWPDHNDDVDFMAFAPSRAVMASIAGFEPDDDSHFVIVNNTTLADGKAVYDYSLTHMRIATDIREQYDFLAATGSGTKYSSAHTPVKLPFSHRLAKVELRAWGDNPLYRIEIAGVRVGYVPVEGSFNLAKCASSESGWSISPDMARGKVEYIFNNQNHDYSLADAPVVIDKNEGLCNDPDHDISLMGEGGAAMLIPVSAPAWDRTVANKTSGTYLGVLMRVSNLRNGKLMYPYSEEKQPMEKIWLAVNEQGLVAERLYRGTDGNFYTDEATKTLYAGDLSAVREYGWAAIPVDIDWEEGQHYIYTIDYSSGLGVKDPDDTHPGEIILGNPEVNVGVKVSSWVENEDYDPGISVPRH